uniref:Uncharacterized protein n=1 Tax=Rhizophora mucronata TaxID=61149 RepID=A0A2P2NXA5_RHIMU
MHVMHVACSLLCKNRRASVQLLRFLEIEQLCFSFSSYNKGLSFSLFSLSF